MSISAKNRRHFIIVTVLVVIFTVIMGVLLNAVLPLPVEASAQASAVDWLFNLHMWLIAFLFSLVVVFMVYAMVVFRRRNGDESEGEHFEGNTTLEILWTVAPLVLVVIFSFIGLRTLQDITAGSPDAEIVKVNGFQWAWSFEYANGVTSAELVLPVNRPMQMDMQAADVIHSFWVPEFRLKQDLVPGMTTTLNFTPTREGEYKLRCAELCGLSHWSMLAPIRVVSEEEYIAWLDQKLVEQSQQTASR